ncbi:hypothetical protein HNQ80_004177 [Anaerosolibacter carboniphilus]|uniref:Uncharacterized protein n=1 Tax=Anaerosolibacter carboniphilus TaxID=1417629 RepID=A0A841L0D9_9FIRM|nr:hypothetical protein [Anaerosolibacter carboniphilus]MBB6218038.1 hypothetical protein [Anaerosolibacter carboniphilus]
MEKAGLKLRHWSEETTTGHHYVSRVDSYIIRMRDREEIERKYEEKRKSRNVFYRILKNLNI